MTRQQTISTQSWLGMLALALIWGGSFLSFAIALRELPVFTLVAARVSFAALALWLLVPVLRIPVPRGWSVWSALFVMGLLQNAIPFSLIAWGQTHVESGLASILNASTAIFGVLIAAAFLADERLNARKLAGVLLGFFGVSIVIGLDNLRHLDLRSVAQLAILGSSLSYGLGGTWARLKLRGLAPLSSALGMLTCSSLVMIALALVIDGVPAAVPHAATWLAVAYISLIATALAFILYYRVLASAGSGNTSLITLLVAPVAVILGVVFLNETLPGTAYAGFVLLALGLLVIDGRILRTFSRATGDIPG